MNKVAKNAIWIIAGRVVQSLLALVINMLTARYLGPSNFGLITYASSLVAFVVPIMELGFGNVLVKEIINRPEAEGKVLGTTVFFSVCSSLCCIIGVTAFAFVANPNEPTTILVCLLYSLILVFQATDHIRYWFQAKLLSKYTAIIKLIAYVSVSAYKVFLLITSKSVLWFALSNAFDYALISAGSIYTYRRLGGQRFSVSKKIGKDIFTRSKHYILSSMMVTVFAQTDKVMIKLMIDETATGYYGAAVACAGMTSFVFSAIIDSFRPSILEGANASQEVFQKRLTMLYSLIIYMSLAQSILMTVFARLIIRILYGAAYYSAAGALQIIVWYTTFSYLGSVRNIWILANDKQEYLWKINILGASANVFLNAILIPIIGIYGAALASLITQFFTNVVVGYILKPILPNNQIMVQGLNPRYVIEAVNKIRNKNTRTL